MSKLPAKKTRRTPRPMPKAETLHALRVAHLRISQLEEERNNLLTQQTASEAEQVRIRMDTAALQAMHSNLLEATGLAADQAAKLEEISEQLLHRQGIIERQSKIIATQQEGMRRQEIEIATLRGYQTHVRETDRLRHGFPVNTGSEPALNIRTG